MKKTIRIPALIAPGGLYTAWGYTNSDATPQKPDWRIMYDGTDGWPVDEVDIKKVFVEVEVDFPDVAADPTFIGVVEDEAAAGKVDKP